MPRIRDEYLNCVVYLYPSEAAADDGERIGGSGFLVGVPSQGLAPTFRFLYVVTNKHVIKNSTVIRMNAVDGRKVILPTDRSSWVVHPGGDDLAARQVFFDPRDFRFNFVPRSTFLTKEIINEYAIGPGDEAFMVGRFINHEGRQGNLPTARFGNISQMPWEPIKQDHGHEQESFLVEARSIGGYSGSPVFVHIPPASIRFGVKDWTMPEKILSAHGPWLLGVDWGHLSDWSYVRRENGEPVNPANPQAMQVRLNTGMTAVVPAWNLAELLDTGVLAEQREQLVRKRREHEVNNPPAETMDDGGFTSS